MLINALEVVIEEEGNGKVAYEARGLLVHVKFIMAFEVLLDLLMHTKSLSNYLQQRLCVSYRCDYITGGAPE